MAAAALSVNSCLRPSSSLPPPVSYSMPPPTRIVSVPWAMSKDDAGSWRSRCVSTMACVVVGATIGLGADGQALAGELGAADRTSSMPEQAATSAKVLRWSDKRACPPWQANSLESVVPENLPRPLGGRSNRFALYKGMAPAIGSSSSSIRFDSSCYSL